MPKHSHVTLALVCLVVLASPALARGIGTWSYLVTSDGQLAASLGETRSDLLDPAGFVVYRYREGRVTAAPLDKPDMVLWTANAKPVLLYGRGPLWRLTPDVLVIFGEDSILGLERTSGKVRYETRSEQFTRNSSFFKYIGELSKPPAPTMYLIDDAAQAEERVPDEQKPKAVARVARFDLQRGEFLWKADIVTAAGVKLRPSDIDLRGAVHGQAGDDNFYFDPATGKALDKYLDVNSTPDTDPFAAALAAAPAGEQPKPGEFYTVNRSADKIVAEDVQGKQLWERKEPGVKALELRTTDSLLIPLVTERVKVQLLALNKKDGAERWRRELPPGGFADELTVEVQAAKTGYLVQVHWRVLD